MESKKKEVVNEMENKLPPHYENRSVETEELDNARVPGIPRMRGTNKEIDDTFKKLDLKRHPSPVVTTPWNNITLAFECTGDGSIPHYQMFEQLHKQIDPFGHLMGNIIQYTFSDDEEYDEVPLELAIAEATLANGNATQLRIRNVKIWVENSPLLSFQIYEPKQKCDEHQKLALVHEIKDNTLKTKTFGCKLPYHLRQTVHYSLDHANSRANLVSYQTCSTSKIIIHFNAEWKSMDISRDDFKVKIHDVRFDTEKNQRRKMFPRLPSVTVHKHQHTSRNRKRSLSDTPSKVMQDWKNDPLLLKLKEKGDTVTSKVLQDWKNDPLYLELKAEREKELGYSDSKRTTESREDPTAGAFPSFLNKPTMVENPLLSAMENLNTEFFEKAIECITGRIETQPQAKEASSVRSSLYEEYCKMFKIESGEKGNSMVKKKEPFHSEDEDDGKEDKR